MKAPHEQQPVVQRIRIKYAKRGRLRFTSHRDFARALERAVRRAEIPIAYSSGFTPHPRISYAGASSTGVASEAEYLEIALASVVDIESIMSKLDAALPIGLDVMEIIEASTPGFAERLEASLWHFDVTAESSVAAQLPAAARVLMAATECIVERHTKNGIRSFDVRQAVERLDCRLKPGLAEPAGASSWRGVSVSDPSAILEAVIRHGSPSVRPDDLLAALRIEGLASRVIVTRLAQGPFDRGAGAVADPFGPDRK